MEYKIYHSPGKIIYKEGWYLDQLSEEEIWQSNRWIHRYLKNKYNLTPEQYYGIIVENDPNWRSKCPYCGKEGGHFQSIIKGWTYYCNQSCITKERLERESKLGINPFQNPKFIEENRIRAAITQRRRMETGISQLLNPQVMMKASRESFKSLYGKYEGFLYVARCNQDNSKFKVGITTNNYDSRWRCKDGYLDRHHRLLSGLGNDLADIEYELKLKFCDGHSELIPTSKLHEFLKEVRKYK